MSTGRVLSSTELDEGAFDAREFPLLAAAMQGACGQELQAELQRWSKRYFAPRARRCVTKILAKLVRNVAGQKFIDTVLVRDISASGLQVAVHRNAVSSLPALATVQFLLSAGRGAGRREFEVQAKLVRVVNMGEEFIVLGFRFSDMTAERVLALDELSQSLSMPAIKLPARPASLAPGHK